eukprot:TRINITY_DN30276_c0_g1_i1.p2 TRINITY_DN30276_c0_g1~~TRINITY_DN30276_c0_g1_i1.p2  ORF type:complete len:230 (-),score=55.48 TRINITY_DN30276_c0_g1_i1:49-738(-)
MRFARTGREVVAVRSGWAAAAAAQAKDNVKVLLQNVAAPAAAGRRAVDDSAGRADFRGVVPGANAAAPGGDAGAGDLEETIFPPSFRRGAAAADATVQAAAAVVAPPAARIAGAGFAGPSDTRVHAGANTRAIPGKSLSPRPDAGGGAQAIAANGALRLGRPSNPGAAAAAAASVDAVRAQIRGIREEQIREAAALENGENFRGGRLAARRMESIMRVGAGPDLLSWKT